MKGRNRKQVVFPSFLPLRCGRRTLLNEKLFKHHLSRLPPRLSSLHGRSNFPDSALHSCILRSCVARCHNVQQHAPASNDGKALSANQSRAVKSRHPQIFQVWIIMGSAALAAGVLLYGYINFLSTGNATSSSGLPFIQTGALIGLLGLVVFSIITNNIFKKMREASTQMSSVPVSSGASTSTGSTSAMTGLQKRLKVVGLTGMILLVIVVALMIIGANI